MKKFLLGFLLSLGLASALPGAAADLPSIGFTTSRAAFENGDSIAVQEVRASSANLTPGVTFLVRGTYTLSSRDSAILSISLTTTEPVGVPSQSTARRQISRGTGTFEMEYTIQFAGTVYLALTPATGGGNSFGRIYVGGIEDPAPRPSTPTTPPPPSIPPAPPVNTAGLSPVPFVTSRSQFSAGDGITLQQVLASSPRLESGDRVLVRGNYTLQSRASALLMLSLTRNAPGSWDAVSPSSRINITAAGSGTFELAYEIKQPGSLHVSFYGTGTDGNSFGGVYFAPPTAVSAAAAVAVTHPAANTGRFGNLAVRSNVSAGDGALIAGLTVTEQERYVLIRGIGPSLAAFGVGNVLRKPVLTVYNASGEPIASASAWSTAFTGDRRTGIELLMSSVGAFPLTAGSEDTVLNLRLTPGNYTMSISTGDGQPGAALLEVYASSTFSLPAAP